MKSRSVLRALLASSVFMAVLMLAVYIGLAATWNLPPSFRRSSAKFLLTFEFGLGGEHHVFKRRYACDVRKSSWLQMDILTGRPPVFRFKISDNEVLYLFRPTHPTDWHCDAKVREVYTADDPKPPAAVLVAMSKDGEISLERYEMVVTRPSGGMQDQGFDYSSIKVTVDPMPSWHIWKFIRRQDFIENFWVKQAPGYGPKVTSEHLVRMAYFESLRDWVIPRAVWSNAGIEPGDLPSGSAPMLLQLGDFGHLRPEGVGKNGWLSLPGPAWHFLNQPEYRLFEMRTFSPMVQDLVTGIWERRVSMTNVSRYFDTGLTCSPLGEDPTKDKPADWCGNVSLRSGNLVVLKIGQQSIQVRKADLSSRKGVWIYDPFDESIHIVSQQFNFIPLPIENIFED